MLIDFKQNTLVLWNSVTLEIQAAFQLGCQRIISMTYTPTLTSGLDGTHSADSGHYYGRALDFRVRDIPYELRMPLKNEAQEILGPDFLVILANTHYHIQKNKV